MSEELAEKLVETIDNVTRWAEQAGNLAAEQAPLVVHEILAWTLWINVFTAVVCVCVVAFVTPRFKGWIKRLDERDEHYTPVLVAGGIAWIVAMLVFLAEAAPSIIKVLVSPRLVVLDALKGLL